MGEGVWPRGGYAASGSLITRSRSGQQQFNYFELGGNAAESPRISPRPRISPSYRDVSRGNPGELLLGPMMVSTAPHSSTLRPVPPRAGVSLNAFWRRTVSL